MYWYPDSSRILVMRTPVKMCPLKIRSSLATARKAESAEGDLRPERCDGSQPYKAVVPGQPLYSLRGLQG